MDILSEFLTKSKNRKLKIAVIGDSLIDEYYAVKVNRISPEFPIPVLFSEDDKPVSVVPGGAANVCSQMKHWNVDVDLLSIFDEKSAETFSNHDFSCKYSVIFNECVTPRKKRYYDGDFPLDRWDVELKSVPKTENWQKARIQLFNNFLEMVKTSKPDVLILSDYNKGIFTRNGISSAIIEHCNLNDIHVLVDPKSLNIDLWKGCKVIKPNANWAKSFCEKYGFESSGDNWQDEMSFIKEKINCHSVILTASGDGVGYYEESGHFIKSPDLSKNRPIIRSVIGAGDCFSSFFAMSYALGMSLENSIKVAFNGANAYIQDKHNSPVTPYQFHKWFNPIKAKSVSVEELVDIKNQLSKQTWVWTNGCFDAGMHSGHLKTFEEARKLGDKVIVGLNTDESIKRLKGETRPIFSYKEREQLLINLHNVDFVVPIEEDTPGSIIEKLSVNMIVKGSDYKKENVSGVNVVGKDNVHLIPLVENVSTSKIIERMKNG